MAARQARAPAAPATVPPEVQGLRAAWEELCVPHGFAPWPERTSARLVEDCQAALAERPLSEWRQVFALVPRSPLCRGELSHRRRVDLLWLLRGRVKGDGYAPADKLLHGAWSLDPAPMTATPPEAPGRAPAAPPGDESPAGLAWSRVLASLREEKLEYALRWLVDLRAVALEGQSLLLAARDKYQLGWVAEHFDELLQAHAQQVGLAGVRYQLAGGGAP